MARITPWLLQCLLAVVTASHWSHSPSGQHPLDPGRLQQPPSQDLQQPPPRHAGDVNDPRYDALVALHRDLVNINSISGHEHAVGIFLESYLKSLNYTVERQNVDPLVNSCPPSTDATALSTDPPTCQRVAQRFNLLAHPKGHRQTPLLLTSHIDTVPPFYPFHIARDGELWGRGAVDAKACAATQLFAAQSLLRSKSIPTDSVSHLFVVGEEVGGDGMMAANSLGLHWETVIFGEPTELKLASGHKGILIFTVKAHGKAAHSGYPWLGASATGMLVRALAALQAMELPSSQKYGDSTLNIGVIEGGVAANVVAENATAKIGIRIAGGSADAVKKMVLDTIKTAVNDGPIEVKFHGGAYGPVNIDHDVPGFETITVNYGTDIANLKGTHKRYLYGPGSILVAHSDHEHLGKADLVAAVEGYERLVLHALGMGKESVEQN